MTFVLDAFSYVTFPTLKNTSSFGRILEGSKNNKLGAFPGVLIYFFFEGGGNGSHIPCISYSKKMTYYCVFSGYLKTVSVFKDIFLLFTRKKISHIGNCKQINIPCSGKKFTWGEQVQWGGDLWCGLTSQYCALSPFATSIGNPVQSDVSCPPSIINSGIGFYFKNEDSGNEAPAYCASFLDGPYKCQVV